jgi:hypothetical protein
MFPALPSFYRSTCLRTGTDQERELWIRFDAFAAPSANTRSLREAVDAESAAISRSAGWRYAARLMEAGGTP